MRRRRLVLSATLLSLILSAASLLWLAAGRMNGGVNPETFGRIEKGMLISDVIDILGAPPDGGTGAGDVDIWFGQDAIVAVWFDTAGRVTTTRYDKQPAYYRARLMWKWISSRL